MKSRDELHEYWRNPEPKNQPDKYIVHPYRTEYLVGLFARFVDKGYSVMEVGSNVGRNLRGLWGAGYNILTGIEINDNAVDLMRLTYPDMEAFVYRMPAENMGTLETAMVDVIFSMCVLMHIHPDSEFIFKEMARVAGKYIITIEDEVKETWRHCPRNYKEVFEPFGFEQVFEEVVPWGENGCAARVMKRVDK